MKNSISLPFPAKPPQASAHSQGHRGTVVNSPQLREGTLQPTGAVSFAEQARCDGGIHGFCLPDFNAQQLRLPGMAASALSGPALQIRQG